MVTNCRKIIVMKIRFKHIVMSVMFGTSALMFTGCEDNLDPVLESLELNRVLSPINLTAKIRNRTTVELNWTASPTAERYVVEFSESSDFSTVVKTAEVVGEDLPLSVAMAGETLYNIRVKGVKEGKQDSKWSTITAQTDVENIFTALPVGNIEATSVKLNWPAGSEVTGFLIMPGNIQRAITSEEKAAGEAVITGLTGETTYTVQLLNGAKHRGSAIFTTLIDLGGAIKVEPTDDYVSILKAANDGDVFAFMPGEYTIGKLSITKNISIKGVRPANRPIIHALLSLEAGVSLEVKDIIFDGAEAGGAGIKGDHVFQLNTAAVAYGNIKFDGCLMRNYLKGIMYLNVAANAESITINNCIITAIDCNGGDFFDCRLGTPKIVNFTNNTVYGLGMARDIFRIDDKSSSFPGVAPKITVDHNTFVGVANDAARRIFYVRWVGNDITFTNNIIASTNGILGVSSTSSQAYPQIKTIGNNNYFSAPGFSTGGSANALAIYDVSATAKKLDPGFSSAASGNFKVTNQDVIDANIGDPRWLK